VLKVYTAGKNPTGERKKHLKYLHDHTSKGTPDEKGTGRKQVIKYIKPA